MSTTELERNVRAVSKFTDALLAEMEAPEVVITATPSMLWRVCEKVGVKVVQRVLMHGGSEYADTLSAWLAAKESA